MAANACATLMSTDGSSDELETWARWFRDQLLGVTTVSGGETSTSFSGVDPDRLDEVKDSRRLTLFGPRGSDRSAVGRKIRELAAPGGVWIAVDGASSGAEAVIAAFAAALPRARLSRYRPVSAPNVRRHGGTLRPRGQTACAHWELRLGSIRRKS